MILYLARAAQAADDDDDPKATVIALIVAQELAVRAFKRACAIKNRGSLRNP